MDIKLSAEEVRIMGCLMEKAVTTPEQYPLTLNALVNACNQKSSRDPVMDLPPGIVQRTARGLEDKYLVTKREGQRQGVEKYSQRLCNTPMAKFHFSEAEYAVVCVLLLRGAQTPGELRTRTQRMHEFADNGAVAEVLKALMDREEGACVARLPKKPGRQDHEYMHLFAGEIDSVAEDAATVQRLSVPRQGDRLEALEARVATLEATVRSLADRLGLEGEPGG